VTRYAGDTPSWGDLILSAISRALETLWVALPCTVIDYDSGTQSATLRPAVRDTDDDGETINLPPLVEVPVIFPAGGGTAITWPLDSGDPGVAIFASRSISQWLVSGEINADPEGQRIGSLTDAMFVPGIRPQTDPAPQASGVLALTASDLRLGSTTALDPVALSTANDSNWSALKLWLDTHTHTGGSGGPVGPPSPPLSPSPSSTAASKVSAE
jgi:hypothetical protein